MATADSRAQRALDKWKSRAPRIKRQHSNPQLRPRGARSTHGAVAAKRASEVSPGSHQQHDSRNRRERSTNKTHDTAGAAPKAATETKELSLPWRTTSFHSISSASATFHAPGATRAPQPRSTSSRRHLLAAHASARSLLRSASMRSVKLHGHAWGTTRGVGASHRTPPASACTPRRHRASESAVRRWRDIRSLGVDRGVLSFAGKVLGCLFLCATFGRMVVWLLPLSCLCLFDGVCMCWKLRRAPFVEFRSAAGSSLPST